MFSFNIPAIHLGQKNMGNSMYHDSWRTFENIGKAHPEFALTHTDSVIDTGEREKLNGQFRNGRSRMQFAVTLMKKLKKPVVHVNARLAR